MPASGRSKSAARILSASSLRQALSLRRAWLRLQVVGSASLKSMSSAIRWITPWPLLSEVPPQNTA